MDYFLLLEGNQGTFFFSFSIYHRRLGESNPSNVIGTIMVRKNKVAQD